MIIKTINNKEKKRTNRQNRALWLWFTMFAEALSDAGLDMRKTLKPETEIPWTKESFCDFIFRPIMKAMYQKESTTELTTKELIAVQETITRHMAQKFSLVVDFPSSEEIMNKQMAESGR